MGCLPECWCKMSIWSRILGMRLGRLGIQDRLLETAPFRMFRQPSFLGVVCCLLVLVLDLPNCRGGAEQKPTGAYIMVKYPQKAITGMQVYQITGERQSLVSRNCWWVYQFYTSSTVMLPTKNSGNCRMMFWDPQPFSQNVFQGLPREMEAYQFMAHTCSYV